MVVGGRNWVAPLAIAAVGVILSLVVQDNNFVLMFLSNTMIYIMLSMGLQLMLGSTGLLFLCSAAFWGAGGYTSAYLTARLHWPWLLGLAGAVGVTVALGFILAPIVRLKGTYFAMSTFAIGAMAVVFFRELPFTGGVNGFLGIGPLELFGWTAQTPLSMYYVVLFFLVFQYVVFERLLSSSYGRSLRAIKQNEVAAWASGINVPWTQVKTIILGVAFAGVAGSLLVHTQGFANPDMFSVDKSIFILVMMVVGGSTSLGGTILGAVVMQFLAQYTRELQSYIMLVYGVVLVFCMTFLPAGLAGLVQGISRAATGRLGRRGAAEGRAV